jgi:hypothetical protein
LLSEEAMLVTMMKERDEDKNPHESDE